MRIASSSPPTPTSERSSRREKEARPSVIPVRHGSQRRPDDQAALLKANLPQPEQALKAGSIAVISPDRIRIRALPLPP